MLQLALEIATGGNRDYPITAAIALHQPPTLTFCPPFMPTMAGEGLSVRSMRGKLVQEPAYCVPEAGPERVSVNPYPS